MGDKLIPPTRHRIPRRPRSALVPSLRFVRAENVDDLQSSDYFLRVVGPARNEETTADNHNGINRIQLTQNPNPQLDLSDSEIMQLLEILGIL